ncbi:MAG TPA: type II toxin-antitoxin system RelE/ParE family toxin [Allosphingosinicella sp.]|nr:type II toxin-antitoxin system RelE/ParE family toxin [Allosphingosinicella sp.]
MRTLRFSPEARRDVAEIRRYSRATWGREQAKRYMEALTACVDHVADGTAVTTSFFAGGAGFRRSRCREHLIYFLETQTSVDVVRILHPRMNLGKQLKAED